MAIDKATRERFEVALPTAADEPLWELLATPDDPGGMGEYVYIIPVYRPGQLVYLTNKRIVVRSSIGRDEVFADTDQNSIRMWAEYYWAKKDVWKPLGKGDTGVYTTRVVGWEDRMTDKLRQLYQLALDDEKGRGSRGVMNGLGDITTPESPEEPTPSVSAPNRVPPEPGDAGSDEFNEKWAGFKDEFAEREDGEERQAFQTKWERDDVEPMRRQRKTESQVADDVVVAAKAALSTTRPVRTRAEQLKPEDGPERTPNTEQLAAIESDVGVAVRVLAPPGSGKTYVVELRNVHLIKEGVNPSKIANVTLTKNMAEAGKQRVLATLHHEFPSTNLGEFERWFCTIHALCLRILREEGDSREVISEGFGKKVVQHLAKVHWPNAEERPGWKEIRRFIDGAKNKGFSATDDLEFFVAAAGPYHGRKLDDVRLEFDNILAGSRRYELDDWLRGKLGSIIYTTFADMLLDVELRLNRDADFCQRWQSRFDVVNVDEGQDTNNQAMRILRTLAEPDGRFYIVGDTDQLLFRFAGATPEENLYQGFERAYLDGLTHKLVVNYRSTQSIIGTCNELIAYNYDDKGGPYAEDYRKEIVPRDDAPEGKPVTFNMYADAHAEATAVVELIQELYTESYRSYGDMFIGARTRAQLGYLEGPLVRAGIPFINATGGSFWKSKHIQDIVAYIRLAHHAGDKEAFKRVYNVSSNYMTVPWRNAEDFGQYCTTRYLSHAFMAACGEDYRNIHTAMARRNSWVPGSEDLIGLMSDIVSSLNTDGVAAAMEAVLDLCYKKYLRHDEGLTSSDEAENGKIEDIRTAIDVAGEFGTDAVAFLAHVDEMIKAAEAAAAKDWDGYLVISTVHGLKGQERPVMIGVGLVEFIVREGGQPGYDEGEQPGGLLPHTFSMIDPPDDGILPGPGKGRMEDERDIAYVLVSRAMDECYLTGPGRYRGRFCEPSRFVREMGLMDVPSVSIQSTDDGQTAGNDESTGTDA